MKIRMKVEGEDVCVLEIWEEKVPRVAAAIRRILPFTTTLQHGKLTGDLLLIQTTIVEAWENVWYPENIREGRQAARGKISGAVSFYPPRQQISIIYNDEVPAEPLPVSSIGEVIEGMENVVKSGRGVLVRSRSARGVDPGIEVRASVCESQGLPLTGSRLRRQTRGMATSGASLGRL